jgi:hypothetical protein
MANWPGRVGPLAYRIYTPVRRDGSRAAAGVALQTAGATVKLALL